MGVVLGEANSGMGQEIDVRSWNLRRAVERDVVETLDCTVVVVAVEARYALPPNRPI